MRDMKFDGKVVVLETHKATCRQDLRPATLYYSIMVSRSLYKRAESFVSISVPKRQRYPMQMLPCEPFHV